MHCALQADQCNYYIVVSLYGIQWQILGTGAYMFLRGKLLNSRLKE